ncbi:hypothetical protein T484DRAFT_1757833 [Baffinella frigidus]|nr:hypothetical protein T484DRAFT_1757833 [Cryptophyta sp. CCMP2293]
MPTARNPVVGPVGVHFHGIWHDVSQFFKQSVRNPFVTFNLIFTLVLTFGAMEKFGRTGPGDVTHFTDMSFMDSLPVLGAVSLGLGTPVVPGRLLAGETACSGAENDVHTGGVCFDGKLRMGRSGIFGNGFLGLEQNSFNVPHFIWVATWFATPISLFLVANNMWSIFHQWMWWSLYLFIFLWDVVGLIMMLMWHRSPMYNKIMAFVYFAFSGLLMISVRETWRVLMRGGLEGAPMSSKRPDGVSTVIHPFMQRVSFGVTDPAKGTYEKVANVHVDVKHPGDDVPTVVSHTFTRTVLLLSEFFFLAPVIVSTAYVMSQDRVVPFDIQVRAWQVSLLFGAVVLLEKARKTRLSYVTDTVLVMASGVAVLGVMFLAVPEMIWVCYNLPTRPAMAVVYACFSILLVVAIVNLAVNMYYITFVGKDSHALDEYRDSTAPVMGIDASKTGHTVYTRAVLVMYYFNAVALMIVKAMLMVVVLLGLAQNRLSV